MGYTTDFVGAFKCSKKLSAARRRYLVKFSDTRRVTRDPGKVAELPDPIRNAVKLPIGEEGGYFVGGCGFAGQGNDPSFVGGNTPPAGQPGLWCQWVPDATGWYIGWNGAEKFYEYVSWLEYLIEHFLSPWGIELNGVVRWQGEAPDDRGRIEVKDSVVEAIPDKIEADVATHTDIAFSEEV